MQIQMVETKVRSLKRTGIDWALAQFDPMCEGLEWEWNAEYGVFIGMTDAVDYQNGAKVSTRVGAAFLGGNFGKYFRVRKAFGGIDRYEPSVLGGQFAKLQEDNEIGVWCGGHPDGKWTAKKSDWPDADAVHNDVMALAILQCYLISKTGETVLVPDVLLD